MTEETRFSSSSTLAEPSLAARPLKAQRGTESFLSRFISARDLNTNLHLLLMALPGILLLFVFAYLPMFGIIVAFKNYRFNEGILGSAWVGFENFRFLFGTDAAWRITRNTIVMNAIFITVNTTASLIIAILLNEVYRSRMVKYYQTLLFFPYFISWVVASYFVFGILNASNGLLNQLLISLGFDPVTWYRAPEYWPAILTLANLWNGVGFGSIIYLAGILGISPELFEAAKIDGANKWQQIRYITLPMLLPLIVILTLLAIGKIFNADFGLFYFLPRNTPMLYSTTDVIDTFVYRSLVELGNISMAAAAGFYQSMVGFILVIGANWMVRRYNADYSLF
ncbi:MAG: sugar ABC transporter permease [Caldilineaceae bacterium]|nr:sugar ABC transporter permease [Caldilineaceae bacterium]